MIIKFVFQLLLLSLIILLFGCDTPVRQANSNNEVNKYFRPEIFRPPDEADIAKLRDYFQDPNLEIVTLEFDKILEIQSESFTMSEIRSMSKVNDQLFLKDRNGVLWILNDKFQLAECDTRYRDVLGGEKWGWGLNVYDDRYVYLGFNNIYVIDRMTNIISRYSNMDKIANIHWDGRKYLAYNTIDSNATRNKLITVWSEEFTIQEKIIDNPWYSSEHEMSTDFNLKIIPLNGKIYFIDEYSDRYYVYDNENLEQHQFNIPHFRDKALRQIGIITDPDNFKLETMRKLFWNPIISEDEEIPIIRFYSECEDLTFVAEYDASNDFLRRVYYFNYLGKHKIGYLSSPIVEDNKSLIYLGINSGLNSGAIQQPVLFKISR